MGVSPFPGALWPTLRPRSPAFLARLGDLAPLQTPAAGDQPLFRRGDLIEGLWLIEAGALLIGEGEGEGAGDIPAGSMVGALQGDPPHRYPCEARPGAGCRLRFLSLADAAILAALWPADGAGLAADVERAMARLSLLIAFGDSIVYRGLPTPLRVLLAESAEIVHLRAGERLVSAGERLSAMVIVVSGRLRTQRNDPRYDGGDARGRGLKNRTQEFGPGQSLGERATILAEPQAEEVVATRDTVLAKVPEAAFLNALHRFPEDILRCTLGVAEQNFGKAARGRRQSGGTLPSLALVAADGSVDLAFAARALGTALERRGSLRILTRDDVIAAGFGPAVRDYPQVIPAVGLLDWISDQERQHSCVVYVAGAPTESWTRLCVAQADRIVVVATNRSGSPEPIKALLAPFSEGAEREVTLALLRPPGQRGWPGAEGWLGALGVESFQPMTEGDPRDWHRMARFLTGRAVGVVLSGGGARGFAHIGVLRALEEAGVPVDVVGGTSIGALVAALYAKGMSLDRITDAIMAMVKRSEQITLPMVALTSGRRFTQGLRELFADLLIRDLDRTFFSVSCNLTTAETKVHRDGPVWQAVLASNSPPGLFPPVVIDNELYVDGGLLNGLPIDVMMQMNEGGRLIVSDVNANATMAAAECREDGLSGWEVIWRKANPFLDPVAMPGIREIIGRSMAIGSLAQRKKVLRRKTDLKLCPPVGGFPMHGHKKGVQISDIGYISTRNDIVDWWARQTIT
ncbi:cyclic nucleotide-binding protein [Rhodospirillum rubrum]|uniref:cyclic nucleotide-binding and patatin-like phospholipase domain-containing protein n=1 Tax=Rhodospirillum rubrum TaxID=1085 RepID=UPI001908693F|nr:cyclic nucleotide-binding and patatin-like phospholipase domain-containing protein [Rhodospirillum rubrum]MBK1665922.1 cyclic nucleotide-binding protein [Rhodospirillum rubrum]MBK1678041.1 cyclic nucleotide-binding protein [Rhodospirillum rubrum]